tara:strand:- start:34 stop:495 length:462 start_codon:yes stop_codon:yes gene_type:complete
MEFNNLVKGILQSLNETKSAPDNHYYTKTGKLRKGNPKSDGRGGPKFASDPTDRKNYGPRKKTEGEEIPTEDAEGKIDKDRMKCNTSRRTSGGSKKFVVKACKDGKEKIVRYGDPNMKIKKSNPKRRKSFRARHKCDQKKDKFSAGYWSCKKW